MKESIVNTVPTITTTRPYVADPADMAAITGKPVQQCHVHPMHLVPTFSVGQQVTVFADQDSWLDGMTGTVDALTIGRRDSGMIAVRIDGPTPIGHSPVRLVDARRLAPLSTCEHCAIGGGCDCNMHNPDDGCRHIGCWGPKATDTCPGAVVERARYAARNFAHHGVNR